MAKAPVRFVEKPDAHIAGAGYTKLDYQVAALLTDMGETAKLSYAHNIDPTTTAGAEVVKSLKSEATPTVITLGCVLGACNAPVSGAPCYSSVILRTGYGRSYMSPHLL